MDRTGAELIAKDGTAKECIGQQSKGKVSMKIVAVTIKGTSAFLMNRFTEEAEQQHPTRKALVQQKTPREVATKATYQDEQGHFYFPSICVKRLLSAVASNHKMKGQRRSARFVVPGAVRVSPEVVTLTNGDGKTPLTDFEVDSRPIVIPSTRGRVMRHRPRFDSWSASFTLCIRDDLLPVDFVHALLIEGGDMNGLGDFRPERGGEFGTFVIIEWREQA